MTRQPALAAFLPLLLGKTIDRPAGPSRRCKVIAGTQPWHGECPIRRPSVRIFRTSYSCVSYICLADTTVLLHHCSELWACGMLMAGSNFGTAHWHPDCPIDRPSVTILLHVRSLSTRSNFGREKFPIRSPILLVQLWDTTLAKWAQVAVQMSEFWWQIRFYFMYRYWNTKHAWEVGNLLCWSSVEICSAMSDDCCFSNAV